MFSRTTPECDGPAPEHDPLHLRIATAVVVLGLIAACVTVIWRDVAGHSGDLVPQTASPRTISPPASPGGLGQPSASRARAGDLAQKALVVIPVRSPNDVASDTASVTSSGCSIGSPPTKWTICIVGICAAWRMVAVAAMTLGRTSHPSTLQVARVSTMVS